MSACAPTPCLFVLSLVCLGHPLRPLHVSKNITRKIGLGTDERRWITNNGTNSRETHGKARTRTKAYNKRAPRLFFCFSDPSSISFSFDVRPSTCKSSLCTYRAERLTTSLGISAGGAISRHMIVECSSGTLKRERVVNIHAQASQERILPQKLEYCFVSHQPGRIVSPEQGKDASCRGLTGLCMRNGRYVNWPFYT